MVIELVKNPPVPAVAVVIRVLVIIISWSALGNKSKNKRSAKKIYEIIKGASNRLQELIKFLPVRILSILLLYGSYTGFWLTCWLIEENLKKIFKMNFYWHN